MGKMALPAVPALVAQLKEDRHKEARETAARALGRIGKAVKTNRDAEEALRRAGDKDADPVTRVVALGALAMMDQDVPRQVAALRKYLHHDDALARMKACHAAGHAGHRRAGRGTRNRGGAGEGNRLASARIHRPVAG